MASSYLKIHIMYYAFLQLVLRDNDIVEVPREIYKCQKLKTLFLQVNQINILPPELCKYHYLFILYPRSAFPGTVVVIVLTIAQKTSVALYPNYINNNNK